MHPFIAAALRIAAGEIGTKEIGFTNKGKRVGEYQNATTLGGTGWSWCAAFIAWVLLQASLACHFKNIWLNSASCDEILYWSRRRNLVRSAPTKGCIGLVMKSSGDATHIFLVEEVEGDKLTTIEGNTNLTGSANGDGVYRLRSRRISQRRSSDGGAKYVFIDLTPLLPMAAETTVDNRYTLCIGENQVIAATGQPLKMPLIDNVSYAPLNLWAHYLGFGLAFDNEDQIPVFTQASGARREVLAPLMHLDCDGDGKLDDCAPVRVLAGSAGLALAVDPAKRVVTAYRKAS